MRHEFDLIEQVFKPLELAQSSHAQTVSVGIGDDGAVLNLPTNAQLVLVMDTLIEGVHFPKGTAPFFIAWKALAVNLSDLAAMGATPAFYSLALTLPKGHEFDEDWFSALAAGFSALNQTYHISLIGGDTTQGDQLTLTVTAHGWVETGQAILRSGAQVGDVICVSGAIGDGGLGLKAVLDSLEYPVAIRKLNQPEPRVELGQFLKGRAHSAIDISDGLLADLSHILKASNCGAELNLEQIPLSFELMDFQKQLDLPDPLWPMTAGDDYELCFTVPQEKLAEVLSFSSEVRSIGRICSQKGLRVLDKAGQAVSLARLGFQHF